MANETPDDGMKCKQCAGPVPQFIFGRGEWYITATNAERGPYCSEECVAQAKREEMKRG